MKSLKLFVSVMIAVLMSCLLTAHSAGAQVLVINEIDYDQPGTDTSEFLEIKNVGAAGADLSEYTLELVNGTGGGASIYSSIALPAVTLAAGDYYVVCGDAANVANCDLDVSPDSNLIQNGSPDAVGLRHNGVLVDAVSYEGDSGAPYIEGSGTGVEDNSTVVNVGISRFPDGADTNQNNVDFSLRCSTPGEANVAGSTNCILSGLVINEVDYDQPGTDTSEFIEIKNVGTNGADLSEYTLELVNGTGGGASIYSSVALPAVTLAAGDYYVVCGDAANVTNCDLDITPDSNLVQNGAPDAVGLRRNGSLVDAVSYEGDSGAPYIEGSGTGVEDNPAVDNAGISRFPDGADTNQNNVDFSLRCSTPGEANVAQSSGCIFSGSVKIHDVQGSGAVSPLAGTSVVIEGIVVGDFQDGPSGTNGDLNGFFVQEEDADADSDPMTSEGIFVYDGTSPSVNVASGDLVSIQGQVAELSGLTEITSLSAVTVLSSGNPLPTAAAVTLPVTDINDFEAYEGMLVTFPQTLYISDYFNFGRFGEIVLTTARQFQPTAVYEPGSFEVANLAIANSLSRITLDDGRGSQDPDPAIHPNGGVFDLTNLFRGGDTVQNVTGVMDYAFGAYRIQPTQGADYTNANPRTALPDDVGGGLKVVSFDVLNYFTTIDDGVNDICGPLQDQACRGADNSEELTRQRDKIIAALTDIDADIAGLVTIENYPGDVPTADLVSGLNDVLGAGTYDYVATGAIGSDAVRVAIIYKPAAVSPVGAYAILDSSVDSRFLDVYNHPALARSFQDNTTGGIFTVVVNHLKSKGSSCDDDPDTGNGAGNCNQTRKAAAEALVDWLATDPTGSGDGDIIIIGDLNSYDKEDPIDAIVTAGYTDLIKNYLGEYAYSYIFDGQAGYLDYALANAGLMSKVTGVTIWHINADEPGLIDYDTTFKQDAQDAIYAPDAYRSSDHDPVIVGFSVCDEIAPVFDSVAVSPDMLWPPDHKYVDVAATVVVSDNFDPNPAVTLISVTSNEPDNGDDDGDTVSDIVIVDDFHFQLRAERSGTGTGRIYTITYMVTDACGNSTTAEVTVTVPLSLSM